MLLKSCSVNLPCSVLIPTVSQIVAESTIWGSGRLRELGSRHMDILVIALRSIMIVMSVSAESACESDGARVYAVAERAAHLIRKV